MVDEFCHLGVLELARLYRRREISPVEVVNDHLQRCERLNPGLNAFLLILRKSAIQAGQAMENLFQAGIDLGPLQGVPVSVKDIIRLRARSPRPLPGFCSRSPRIKRMPESFGYCGRRVRSLSARPTCTSSPQGTRTPTALSAWFRIPDASVTTRAVQAVVQEPRLLQVWESSPWERIPAARSGSQPAYAGSPVLSQRPARWVWRALFL